MPKSAKRLISHNFLWRLNEVDAMKNRIFNSTSDGDKSIETPLIWLAVLELEGLDCEVYLVNNSTEVISYIKPSSHGFFSSGEELLLLENNNKLDYKDIQPNEAVLVDSFNRLYDSDSNLILSMEIKSELTGNVIVTTESSKGEIKEQAILLAKRVYKGTLSIENLD
jgi:hypothetical protein